MGLSACNPKLNNNHLIVTTRDHVHEIGKLAEGVVVGSAIVNAIGESYQDGKDIRPAIRDFVANLVSKSRHQSTEGPLKTRPLNEACNGVEKTGTQLPSNFGEFGGCYAPEILMGALEELETAYVSLRGDPSFEEELKSFHSYVGRLFSGVYSLISHSL